MLPPGSGRRRSVAKRPTASTLEMLPTCQSTQFQTFVAGRPDSLDSLRYIMGLLPLVA